jgi:hypothetical protein
VALREMFWTDRDEVTEDWRKLHNEELRDLYCSPDVVRVIKSSRTRWVGHVACVGRKVQCFVGNRREGDCLEDLSVDGRLLQIYVSNN